ncbi:MAG: M48 family metalloprotease [Bauldia sp.]
MISSLPRTILPLALGLGLLGSAALVSKTDTRVPGTSAVLQIWGDLARDFDSVGMAITRVSAAKEKAIGDAIAGDIEAYQLSKDVRLQAYVEGVGNLMIKAAGEQPFPYTFRVIDSSQVNAFAIPGGHVYVTTGMLDELQSEAELAAIIGHEISHVALRHCIARLQYELFTRRIAGDNIAAIVGEAHRLFTSTYDRQQETDADLNGMLLAAKAGYDPRATLGALHILVRLETGDQRPATRTATGEIIGGIGKIMTDLGRSHPEAVQRIADAEAMLQRNAGAWRGERFYLGVRNLTEKDARMVIAHDDEWTVFADAGAP